MTQLVPKKHPHGEMSLSREDGQEILSDLAVIYWARCDEMRAQGAEERPASEGEPTGIAIL